MEKNDLDRAAGESELARAFVGNDPKESVGNDPKESVGNDPKESVGNDPKELKQSKTAKKRPKDGAKRSPIIGIAILILGVAILIAGIVMLVLKVTQMNQLQDGEYLTSVKEWVMESPATNCGEVTEPTNCADSGKVIWQFTEIGKGTLTTNNHVNDYGFIWAVEDGKLLIETDWLYPLENRYSYTLDQGAGTLKLTTDSDEYVFHAVKNEMSE